MRNLIALLAAIFLLSMAHASERFEETRPVAAAGVVEISNVRGSIRVQGSARDDVAISGVLGQGAKGLDVTGDEQRLSIRINYPDQEGGWFSWWGGDKLGPSELVVELPASVSLIVNGISASARVTGAAGARVEINTVSGDVSYSGSASELAIEAVSGDIEASGSAADVSAQSVSGGITLQVAITERLSIETVSGDARVESVVPLRRLQADAVSGDIWLAIAMAPGARIKAECLSGDLTLGLPSTSSAALRAETFSGTINSDAGKVSHEEYGPGARLTTQLGAGDGDIRLETFSGGIVINTREK